MLVVGGGTAGTAVSAKLSYSLGADKVIVLDSAEVPKISINCQGQANKF